MIRRIRLLPVLMTVAGLALAARVVDVWQGFAVMAQENPPAVEGEAAAGEEPAENSAVPADSNLAPESIFQLPPDPLSMTDEEVNLLQSLAERRDEIERRGRQLEEREVLLQAAERRIEEKVSGLKALQKTIEDLLNEHKAKTESQYDSLVKVYENMKPKSAARIFEELEMEVLLPVIERMKERKIAPILAKMDAEKAKAITTELAQRRKLPDNG